MFEQCLLCNLDFPLLSRRVLLCFNETLSTSLVCCFSLLYCCSTNTIVILIYQRNLMRRIDQKCLSTDDSAHAVIHQRNKVTRRLGTSMLFAMTQIRHVDEHLHLIRTILNNAIQGSEDKQNKRKRRRKKTICTRTSLVTIWTIVHRRRCSFSLATNLSCAFVSSRNRSATRENDARQRESRRNHLDLFTKTRVYEMDGTYVSFPLKITGGYLSHSSTQRES